ncbi:MAG: DUF2000 domain-containing protein [Ruminococcus sp.]|nr:DUF2000 domain-containing protein [Ruminococcus sp.]
MNEMQNGSFMTSEEKHDRCVLIMNDLIEGGHLANAIGVISLTVGQRHPYFAAGPLVDASGYAHPGLIAVGIPMLKDSNENIKAIRAKAIEKGFDVVDFPKQGQQTKNYDEFIEMMRSAEPDEIEYLGIAIIGKKNAVNRLTKHCQMIV